MHCQRLQRKCLTAENTHKQKDVRGLHGFKQWVEGSLGITTNEALQKLAIFTQFYKHVTQRHSHLMILALTVLTLRPRFPTTQY